VIAELKWKDVEELVTYGVKDCMRLDLADTPLFIADNALLGGSYSAGLLAQESKEKVRGMLFCAQLLDTASVHVTAAIFFCHFRYWRHSSRVLAHPRCTSLAAPCSVHLAWAGSTA
jgi:hypothetical protein